MNPKYNTDPRLDLVFERTVDFPRESIWAAWTNPELVKRWFAPEPWKTVECEIDLRLGGQFRTVMRSPEGKDFPNVGCYLEIVKYEKLTWTDSLLPGFRPAKEPFMTASIVLESVGRGTLYTAIAMHRDLESRKKHETMGFEQGWGQCLDQLVALMKKA